MFDENNVEIHDAAEEVIKPLLCSL